MQRKLHGEITAENDQKSTLKWGPKRLLNRREPNETGAFMGIGPKTLLAGNPRIIGQKTLIYVHLKI
jgi:hypothetical protein